MKAMIRKMNWGDNMLRAAYFWYHAEKSRCWNNNFFISGSNNLDHSESASWKHNDIWSRCFKLGYLKGYK
jgi:hypothetical protein